ncbi:MAG: Abi family protein [Chitinophagaceae bacterium]
MKYDDFAAVITHARMNRYLLACDGNSRKAMTLYRKNLQLSQELFTIISCFEVALRNAIDSQIALSLGNDWLKDAASNGGVFDNTKCRLAKENINNAIHKLPVYNHYKLVAELGFGFWRFMFAKNQYNATGRVLLNVFPLKPTSTVEVQYNHNFIYQQLASLNEIRNRLAHHEPICFKPGQSIKDTTYARLHYNLIVQLFQWMNINSKSLLYGLNHIETICDEIDKL